jgi:putative intracellular protease/amidase
MFSRLREAVAGTQRQKTGLWRGFAVRDGNLITGQQNFSGTETANLLAETLGRDALNELALANSGSRR